jgi:hypothetical protein
MRGLLESLTGTAAAIREARRNRVSCAAYLSNDPYRFNDPAGPTIDAGIGSSAGRGKDRRPPSHFEERRRSARSARRGMALRV